MSKGDKKILIVLLILFAVIIFVLIVVNKYFVNSESSNNDEILINQYSYLTEVSSPNMFFSVVNNINKYYSAISSGNGRVVYDLLDKKYIKEKDLSSENVINNLNLGEENLKFFGKEMYVISNKEIYLYYVSGYVVKDIMDVNVYDTSNDCYFIVNHNIQTSVYSIIPISEKEYNNKNNKKYNFVDVEYNGNNFFEDSIISAESMAIYYFNDFIGLLGYEPKLAYEKIDADVKSELYPTYEEFIKYIEDNFQKFEDIKFNKYMKYNDSKYSIIDNYNNKYTFEINNVVNYTVEIEYSEG